MAGVPVKSARARGFQEVLLSDGSEAGIFRAALGTYFIGYYLTLLPNLRLYFGPGGMLGSTPPAGNFSLVFWIWEPWWLAALMSALLVLLLLFTAGLWARVVLAPIFILILSFHAANRWFVHEPQPLPL